VTHDDNYIFITDSWNMSNGALSITAPHFHTDHFTAILN